MQLRDYQAAALADVEQLKRRAVLVVAPTGSGKGTMAAELLTWAAAKKLRSAFVVHRRELVADMRKRLEARGVACSDNEFGRNTYTRLMTVQTLLRMTEHARKRLPSVELLVVDEAHHYAADEWKQVVDMLRPRRMIGFTATPQRPDGRSMGDMFTDLVDAVSYSELLHRGYVVPCRVLRPFGPLVHELAQHPADAYVRYGRNEQALMFVARRADAHAALQSLTAYGVPAAVVTSKTPDKARVEALQQLEAGTLRVIVNVSVLTEGVDVPHVSCVVLARPCAHASTYVQIVGRVLRAAPGKREGTLIDLVGASHKHGLPAADREHSLTGKGIALRAPDRPRDTPTTEYELRPVDVLDVELEVVEASREVAPYSTRKLPRRPKTGGRQKKAPASFELQPDRVLNKPSTSKYAPKTRPKPAAMTAGFIYADRGFWQLRWREFKVKHRTGLATRDEAEAHELLAYFREHGPRELLAEVRRRKRRGCSAYLDRGLRSDNHRSRSPAWKILKWDDEKNVRVKVTTYATNEEDARALACLFRAGRDAEAHAIIAQYKTASGITKGPKPRPKPEHEHEASP